VKELNELRSTEITSYLQYKQHACMTFSLFSPGLPDLKDEFTSHATQELEHADRSAERIQELGGVPIFDPEEIADKARQAGVKIKQGRTLKAMIGEDFMLERQQIERYTTLARTIQGSDPVTWMMIVHILAQTEKHASELSGFLERQTETR
jgi:bacterioferritin